MTDMTWSLKKKRETANSNTDLEQMPAHPHLAKKARQTINSKLQQPSQIS